MRGGKQGRMRGNQNDEIRYLKNEDVKHEDMKKSL
jgi:hypothetical protein